MQLKLQKFFLCLGLTILTALPNPEWTFASEKDLNYLMRAATVRVSSLNLRHGPGTQYKVLEVLQGGTPVHYLPEPRRGWVRVTTEQGSTGWTFFKHLKPEHSRRIFPEKDVFQVPGSEPLELSQETPFRFALVNVSGLNVRSGPGTRYEILDILSEGQQIHLLGPQKNRWVKIRLSENVEGWVAGKYLSLIVADPESKPVHELQIPGHRTSLEAGILSYMEDLYRSGRLQRQDILSMVVQDLSSGKLLVSIRPRRRVKSASLIKLPILHAYMLASEKGMLEHSEIIQQHLVKMIRFSSNESTNWILEKLGGPSQVQKLLDQSSMYHELKLVEYIPEDGKTYRNKVSSADLNQILVRTWFHQILGVKSDKEQNRQASKRMLYLMSLPGYKWIQDRIKDGTCFSRRKSVRVWDKTGFVKGINGDAGIVEFNTPNGRRAYTIVLIMERENYLSIPGDANTWSARVAMVLRRISEMSYAFVSSYYNRPNQCGLGLLLQYAGRYQSGGDSKVPL
ncbi:MAG: SH3 domain-containing protein [bacterium]